MWQDFHMLGYLGEGKEDADNSDRKKGRVGKVEEERQGIQF